MLIEPSQASQKNTMVCITDTCFGTFLFREAQNNLTVKKIAEHDPYCVGSTRQFNNVHVALAKSTLGQITQIGPILGYISALHMPIIERVSRPPSVSKAEGFPFLYQQAKGGSTQLHLV